MENPEVVETGTQPVVETVTQQPTEEELKEFELFKKNKTHFQSIADQKIEEAKRVALEEKIRREQIEKQLEEVRNPKPVSQIPVMPEEPVMPSDYDSTDAVTDPKSSSAKYDRAYRDYQAKLIKYQRESFDYQQKQLQSELESFNKIKEDLVKEKKAKQLELNAIAELQKEGLDEQNAREAFKFFSSPESLTAKSFAQMWKAMNNKVDKPTFTQPNPVLGGQQRETVKENEYTKKPDLTELYKIKK